MTLVVRARLRQIVLWILVTTLAAAKTESGWAQQNPKTLAQRQFRENVALPLDSNLRKRFSAVEELLSDRRWTEAISILEEIVQADGKGLVEVQPGSVGGYATYLNVTARCSILLSQVSADGLQSYRRKIDPQAKRWFENWKRTRDETELQRIVRQAFLSSYGDEALIALGDSAWDRGDFSAARLWWEQLQQLPDEVSRADYPTVLRYPDADIEKPTILARIALCSIFERDPIRAEFVVRKFAADYPTAEGWLAGRRGRLADCLMQELDKSRQWQPEKLEAEVETFGQSPSRFRLIPESLDVGSLRWVHSLSPNLLPRQVEGFPFQNEPLSYHPVMTDKIVLVNDSGSVRAWNVLTGKPAWPSDQIDPAIIYPTVSEEPTATPERLCVGVPEYTMTIADGRLFARMGSAVSAVSNQEHRDLESDLICLDLNQEGKLLWKIPARQIFNDGSWRYEGTPVVISGKAYVAMCRRRPQLELMIVCLDSSDGRVVWQQPIGGFRVSVGDSHNRVSHLLLTAGGGRLFLTTDHGLIISLDAFDGRLEWAITYETRTDESSATLSDPQQKGIRPAMFFNGWLIVAPNDSDYAYCIESDSGRMKWRYPYLNQSGKDLPDLMRREHDAGQRTENQWRHLLGVAPGGYAGRLIVSGKSLVAIDLESGHKVWQTPRTAFGRGVLAGDQVLLPGRTTIDVCSQSTGQLIRTIPLETVDSSQGGNLTIASGMLLVAQPNQLAAYSEFSRLKQQIESELTLQQNNSHLLIQLGELEVADGMLERAKAAFEKVVETAKKEDPGYATARRKLSGLFDEAGQSSFEKSDFHEAIDQWQQSLLMADDPSKRVELIFNLARADERLQDLDAALERLQSVLSDERLSSLPFGLLNAGNEAANRMSRIIEKGREPYSRIEGAAARELEQFHANVTTEELQRFIETYPHSQAIYSARQLLADLYRRMDHRSEAYAVLDENRKKAVDELTFVQSTLAMIELHNDTQNGRRVERLWKDLSKHESTMQVISNGRLQSLGQVMADRTKSNSGVRSMSSTSPRDFERSWVCALPHDARVIFPENEPPTSDELSVLVCSRHDRVQNAWHWRCLDWRTGHLRWEETANCPIQIARWTPFHLLIGGPGGWQARSTGNGRRVWGQSIPDDSVPAFAVHSAEPGEDFAWPVLFHSRDGLYLFDPNNGKLVSRFKPPGRIHPVFAIGSPTSLGLSPIGNHANPRKSNLKDESVSHQSLSSKAIIVLFQTINPLKTWIASVPSPLNPWTSFEISYGREAWQVAPFCLENRIIGMTSDQHLVGNEISRFDRSGTESSSTSMVDGMDSKADIAKFLRQPNINEDLGVFEEFSRELSLRESKRRNGIQISGTEEAIKQWSYRNFAMGQSAPIAWAQKGQLLAVSDGSLLMSFNPETGQRKWMAGLADFPIQSPAVQTCCYHNTVYATSQGRLRGINIQTGKIQVENYLGDATAQWKTSVAWSSNQQQSLNEELGKQSIDHEALLAIWPVAVSEGRSFAIWLCDADRGEVVQRLHVDAEPRKIVIDPSGFGIVLTEQSISGLRTRAN